MTLILTLVGALSYYHPGDGHNAGTLSCGGTLTWKSHHVAIRQWRGKCGAPAVVCTPVTHRCVLTKVMDSGPWGATKGKRWQVQIKLKRGWKRRGVVDLSPALYNELGRPPWLSKAYVWVWSQRR